MKKHIIFIAYDTQRGFMLHFYDWICALIAESDDKTRFTIVTTRKEQNPGLLDALDALPIKKAFVSGTQALETVEGLKDCDLVHCQGNQHGYQMVKLKKKLGASFKIMVTLHAFRHGKWYRPFYTNFASLLCLNKVDVLHFVSQLSKTEFLSYNFVHKRSQRSYAFPLGCPKERFQEKADISEFPFYQELSEGKRNIIYLAEFIPRKNHLWLLETLKEILVEYDARLWLFGNNDAAGRERKFIEEAGLDPYVRMPGRVNGKFIPTILSHMQLALCVAHSETMGHTIMEPMFASVPIVTFDVGIACSAVRDFSTGFVIKNDRERVNFQHSVRFLLQNPEQAKAMGKEAEEFANRWLGWDVTAKNCIQLYQSMCETK